MKTTGKCPKCESKKLIRIEPAARDYQAVAVGIFSSVDVTRYLCSQCGYVEEWVESCTDIEKIRAYYQG